MTPTKILQIKGYKVFEKQYDCFGKWNCTVFEYPATGKRIYHQKYQGWYDDTNKTLTKQDLLNL